MKYFEIHKIETKNYYGNTIEQFAIKGCIAIPVRAFIFFGPILFKIPIYGNWEWTRTYTEDNIRSGGNGFTYYFDQGSPNVIYSSLKDAEDRLNNVYIPVYIHPAKTWTKVGSYYGSKTDKHQKLDELYKRLVHAYNEGKREEEELVLREIEKLQA